MFAKLPFMGKEWIVKFEICLDEDNTESNKAAQSILHFTTGGRCCRAFEQYIPGKQDSSI